MDITINHRLIGVKIHVQQGSSEVNPVVFFVPKTDAGVDLSACKFFVSIVDGQGYDKIPVPFTQKDDTIQVQWDIKSRTTAVAGNHPFQLVAENLQQEVVWLTNTSHVIVRESLHVDDPISGFFPLTAVFSNVLFFSCHPSPAGMNGRGPCMKPGPPPFTAPCPSWEPGTPVRPPFPGPVA